MHSIKNIVNYKFVQDSAYTFVSYMILAISGIIANILIGNAYGASGIGIFNQTVAIYMIFSLAAIFGLNTFLCRVYLQTPTQGQLTQMVQVGFLALP